MSGVAASRFEEEEIIDQNTGVTVNRLEHEQASHEQASHEQASHEQASHGQHEQPRDTIVVDYDGSSSSSDEDDDGDGDRFDNGILKSEYLSYPVALRPKPLLLLGLGVAFMSANSIAMTPIIELLKSVFCRQRYPDEEYHLFNPVCNRSDVISDLAQLLMLQTVVSAVGSLVVTPRLSALSDRIGRKKILIFSVATCSSVDLSALIAIYLAPEVFGYKTALLANTSGLCGSVSTIMALMQCYLSDSLKPHVRSRWLGYSTASFTVTIAIGPLIGTVLTQLFHGNLLPILLLSIVLPFVGATFAWFYLPESRTVKARRLSQLSFASARTSRSDVSTVRDRFISILAPLRPLQKLKFENVASLRDRRNAWLLVFFLFFLSEIGVGTGALYILYPQSKFGWTSVETGYVLTLISSLRTVTLLVALPAAIKILGKLWHVSTKRLDMVDGTIIRLSLVAMMCAQVAIIYAKTGPLFLIGVASLSFSSALAPVMTSAIIKFSNKDEVGELLGALSLITSLGSLIAPVIFMRIFVATSESRPNYVFKVVLGIYFVLFVLSAFLLPIRSEDEDRFAVFKRATFGRAPAHQSDNEDEGGVEGNGDISGVAEGGAERRQRAHRTETSPLLQST